MDGPNTKSYHIPSDAVWFITGCSSGIGQALVQYITTHHPTHRVVATARNPAALTHPPNPSVLPLPLDVTSQASINSALDAALTHFHRIDILVNNAGYSLVGDTEVAGDAESRALLDTNFWGVVDLTKRALGIMRDTNPESGGAQGGVILNVSSMGGFIGFPGSAFYHASKFAVEGWTEAVARELPAAWNIHLCNIEPGGVKTNYATTSLKFMSQGRHPAYADPSYPSNRLREYVGKEENRRAWAEPEAIARAMVNVVSRGGRIPIRVPLGADSYGMILAELESIRRDLEETREISLAVGEMEQLESIRFLQRE
ncbi:SDR family oxidoreductase [Aspergillus saccharolyticus JOP 1030-1]|uniref:Short-chain dehydrogenase/reductase-like protein SDR n=1 Tax=Aspergillus saccharolyticus JOP 1030-1 TaxID=1450539 RepID=A0A318ZSD3_9EURO|nr:short-chain dehydrogenase/reductase-like protein SDR [Aspergillus saccharolyticus JOP 1030-1]PYH49605.1 short-chain dehydrogenase/reductase-like protein SDR [Aspergillus saccharolyticus JOP 1030-1]